MSLNFDRHHVEKRHNQRFLGMFLMFVVIAVVLGLTLAFTISGTMTGNSIWSWLFGGGKTYTESAGASAINVTCNDSDGGKNYFVKGLCYENNVLKGTDKCQGLVGCLEYYCTNSSGKCSFVNATCKNVNGSSGECLDGACRPAVDLTIPNCTDSDGGLKIYKKGIVKFLGQIYGTDFCYTNNSNNTQMVNITTNQLMEFYCENGTPKGIYVWCRKGCVNGACLLPLIVNGTNLTSDGEPIGEAGSIDDIGDATRMQFCMNRGYNTYPRTFETLTQCNGRWNTCSAWCRSGNVCTYEGWECWEWAGAFYGNCYCAWNGGGAI